MFLDKRTQDKVLLLSHSGDGIPEELKQFMDINEMPPFVGGKCKKPLIDLWATLDAPSATTASTPSAASSSGASDSNNSAVSSSSGGASNNTSANVSTKDN